MNSVVVLKQHLHVYISICSISLYNIKPHTYIFICFIYYDNIYNNKSRVCQYVTLDTWKQFSSNSFNI